METQLDYVRLACWNESAYTKIVARLMEHWPDDWQQSKWLQYRGWRKDALFIGHAIQQQKSHTVLNISGSLSHRMLPSLLELPEFYATRVDVQVTIENPLGSGDTLALVRDECTTKNTTLIESLENDTLYVGSRTSEAFTRLYEKNLEKSYLRLEFELKGQRARAAWVALVGGEEIHKVFHYYVKRCKLPSRVQAWYSGARSSATKECMAAEITHDAKTKLAWLVSLDACAMRMMASHEIGEQAKAVIRAWGNHADWLDAQAVAIDTK